MKEGRVNPDEVPWDELTADGEPVGWRVLDRDGNVIASGPGMTLEMASNFGEVYDDGSN